MIRELSVLLLTVIVSFQQTESVELSTIASHPCDPNPCENDGKCSPDSSAYGYYCTCPTGVYGYKCDKHKCPPRFQYRANTNTCIKLVLESRSWYEARKRCNELHGSYLTIINNEKEEQDQGELLKSYEADIVARCASVVWIGAQTDDVTCKTPFMWKPTDDIAIPVQYTHWYQYTNSYPNEPDCKGNNKSCIGFVIPVGNYQWSNIDCEYKGCFICESGPY